MDREVIIVIFIITINSVLYCLPNAKQKTVREKGHIEANSCACMHFIATF